MESYELLSGEVIDLSVLSIEDIGFIATLKKEVAGDYPDYFQILRSVKGAGSYILPNGKLTSEICQSILYRVAHDIADRLGIKQGCLLDPSITREDIETALENEDKDNLLSIFEAAQLLRMSHIDTIQLLREGILNGINIKNVWVVRKSDVIDYEKTFVQVDLMEKYKCEE